MSDTFTHLDAENVTTIPDFLAMIRGGNKANPMLKWGEFELPVRLLNAQNEAVEIVKAKQKAMNMNPSRIDMETFESLECMKAILIKAATPADGVKIINDEFFAELNASELTGLYDQYRTIQKTINPSIPSMTDAELWAIIEDVKKKNTKPNELFGYQREAIGILFLEKILPMLQTGNVSGT